MVLSSDLGDRQKDLAENRMDWSSEEATEEAMAQGDQSTGRHCNDRKYYKIHLTTERHSDYGRRALAEALQKAEDQQHRSKDPENQGRKQPVQDAQDPELRVQIHRM